jgi:hypothetical protein
MNARMRSPTFHQGGKVLAVAISPEGLGGEGELATAARKCTVRLRATRSLSPAEYESQRQAQLQLFTADEGLKRAELRAIEKLLKHKMKQAF